MNGDDDSGSDLGSDLYSQLSRKESSRHSLGSDGTSVPEGRIPPHHTEAERSVLGAILLNNEVISRVLEIGLEADDFYRESHQRIFEVALALSERGEPVD